MANGHVIENELTFQTTKHFRTMGKTWRKEEREKNRGRRHRRRSRRRDLDLLRNELYDDADSEYDELIDEWYDE